MRLADLLATERITTSLVAGGKDEVLRALAQLFVAAEPELDAEKIFRVLADREALASTGVGSGVAIPHGRVPGLPKMQAAIALSADGIPFDSVDGRPVHIFFALLAPEKQTGDHLKALARVSRLLRDEGVRKRMVEASSVEELLAVVGAEDR